MNTIKYLGILELDDNNDYIVNGENISDKLNKNWKDEIPAKYSLYIGKEAFISEECVLQKRKNKGLLYDMFAERFNLEDKLFNSVGRNIEFEIASEEVRYVSKYVHKS